MPAMSMYQPAVSHCVAVRRTPPMMARKSRTASDDTGPADREQAGAPVKKPTTISSHPAV